MPAGLRAQLADEFGFQQTTIPASTYDFLDADLATLSTGFLLTAGSKTDNTDAYKMARTWHQQFKFLQNLHPAFSHLKPQMLVSTGSVPPHPGAATYYRETGLVTP